MLQDEKGARPSFEAEPRGPDSAKVGGAANIPNTNVKLESQPGEAEFQKTVQPSPAGNAVSMEESDSQFEG